MIQSESHSYVNSNGIDMHYREAGSGNPIVLLHGLASNLKIWDLVVPLLANDYHVVAVDQRGHGRSSKPTSGYEFESVVNDLHGFLQALNLVTPILVGHSWGADVVLEYGYKHPEGIRGIIMVDGGTIQPSARKDWTLDIAKKEMAPPKFTGLTKESLKSRFSLRNGGLLKNIEGAFEAVLGNFYEVDGILSPNLTLQNHLSIIEALWNHYPSELYKTIDTPCLFFPASPDERPEDSHWVNRKSYFLDCALRDINKCQVNWFTNSIHDLPLQRPVEVVEAINSYVANGFFD